MFQTSLSLANYQTNGHLPCVQPSSNAKLSSGASPLSDRIKELIEIINQISKTLKGQNSASSAQGHGLKLMEDRLSEAMNRYNRELINDSDLDDAGNKHKNLIRMYNLRKALGLSWVSVPKPRRLNSSQIHRFLSEQAPEIFESCKQLGQLYQASSSKQSFFENQAVKETMASIKKGIEKVFFQAAQNDELFKYLDPSQKLSSWLKTLLANGNYLMVRSTGSEDSQQMANAGGNRSVAYVKPTLEGVCGAVGEVVCSYFDPKSLQNRIDCGSNPFQEELKLAVTMQELIGEEIGGSADLKHIPKSAVLFTNEPLYVGNENFRVMRLSCTYGHGEAVVENVGIASDTVLILHSQTDPHKLYILYDNQAKKMRLAPVRDTETGKISLQKIENDPSLVNERVFDDQMLAQIFLWGIIGEKFFEDEATDMELVIKGGVIYPVQGRPVVRSAQLPTYLDLKKISQQNVSPIKKTIRATPQVSGKSSVTAIIEPEQLLISDSLTEVGDKRLFKKGQHQLVVTSKAEPANSHPVVNFSGYGIPCLTANRGIAPIKDLVQQINPTHHLVVCVQSGTFNLWNTSEASSTEFSSKGFVVHPAKISHSFSSTQLSKKPRVQTKADQDLQDLLFLFRTETTKKAALERLQAIQNHGWLKKFAERREELSRNMSTTPLSERAIRPVLDVSEELLCKISHTCKQLVVLLKESDEKRLHPLFFAKVLDTLFFENEKEQGGIGQYSIVNMESHFASAEEQIGYQRELPHAAHFIGQLMFGMECPIPEIFTDWRTFLLQLESIAEKNEHSEWMDQFKSMLTTLKKLGVMPWFMTFTFDESSHLPPLERMKYLCDLLPESEKPLLNELLKQKDALQTMLQHIEAFKHPEKFKKAFENIKKEVEKFIPQEQENILAGSHWAKTSPLIKLVAVDAMNALVYLYDTATKTMKSSLNFSDDKEKTKIFKQMLFPYFSLLKSWVKETLGPNSFPMNGSWTQDRYLDKIFELLTNKNDEDPAQLNPSNDFSVSAAAFGSGTAFERHYPSTLEDVFTLIHQNLLAATAKLLSRLLSDEQIERSRLPIQLKKSISNVPRIGGDFFGVGTPQRIGIEISENQIIVIYNVPLRNHSGRFSLCYSLEEGTSVTSMKAQFLGEARDRWGVSARVIDFYDKLLSLVQSPIEVKPNELAFSLKLENDRALSVSLEIYNMLARYSLDEPILTEINDHIVQLGILDHALDLLIKKDILPELARYYSKSYLREIWDQGIDDDKIKIPLSWQDKECLKINLVSKAFHNELIPVQQSQKDFIFRLGKKMSLELLDLFHSCSVEKGIGFNATLEAVKVGLNQTDLVDLPVRILAANVMLALVKKGWAIPEATEIAKTWVLDANSSLHLPGKNLLLSLLEKGLLLQEAEDIADKWILETNSILYYRMAIEIYSALVENNRAHQKAENALSIDIKDQRLSPYLVRQFFDLIDQLFAKGQGIETVEKLTFDILTKGELVSTDVAKTLYEKLFAIGKGRQSALNAAKIAVFDDGFSKNEIALWIFKQLFEQKVGFQEAIEAASSELLKDDLLLGIKALKLFELLLTKGQGIDEAKKGAEKVINTFLINFSGWELYALLVNAGHAYPEALEAATKQVFCDKIVNHELSVFSALFKKGEGIDQAIKIASEAFSSQNPTIRRNALKLYARLLYDNKAIESAEKAIEAALQSDDSGLKSEAESICVTHFATRIKSSSALITKHAQELSFFYSLYF